MQEQRDKYYAHSKNQQGEKHLLSDHSHDTAELMESFACQECYKNVFHLAGLIHDLGKYQPEFQKYLENGGKRGSVPHASWGAGYARILRSLESSIAIDGHHKGLPDNSTWKSDTEPFNRKEVSGFEDIINNFVRDAGINKSEIKKPDSLTFRDTSQREMFIRCLFSALTDSDWLSTEAHFERDKFNLRLNTILPVDIMLDKLEAELSKKTKDGEINELRNNARAQVLQKSETPYGFYSLALPTGMGKTLTSLAWALLHAKYNRMERIIIVLPYINIIDQTAQILKSIFGEKWVLEHHSSYGEGDLKEDEIENGRFIFQERKKLAVENWDYPIIVTTTVQFFESLFSNRSSKCRKIHNIANSVIIFDEVQTLPKEIILPTLHILEGIQSVMRTSFLFCTATQPAFEKRSGFEGINWIIPLVDNTALLYEKTKRVEYHIVNEFNPIDFDDLRDKIIQTNTTTLIIFNTKKSTLEFYNHNRDLMYWEKKYHLSTAMCPAHRKAVIKNIKDDLDAGRKILVVSTQLIEAGVDFDFPIVFREIAPLEGIIQSAGRCNRENKLGKMGGKVFIFDTQDGGMPDKTYAACAGYAKELIMQNINRLYEHNVFNEYYSNVIKLYVNPDKYRINEARKRFDFKAVNDAYRIIDKITEGLFIYNYNDESRELLHSLEHKKFLSRDDYRKMQNFTVNAYEAFILKNRQMCEIMPQGFTVWYGNYDDSTGISLAPINVEKSII